MLSPDPRHPRARAQHEGYEPRRAALLFVRFSYERGTNYVTIGFNGVPTGIRTPVTSVKGQHNALEDVLVDLHNGGIMEDQYGYAQREEFPGRLV